MRIPACTTTAPSSGRNPPQPSELLQSRQPDTRYVPGKLPPKGPSVIDQSCPKLSHAGNVAARAMLDIPSRTAVSITAQTAFLISILLLKVGCRTHISLRATSPCEGYAQRISMTRGLFTAFLML